MLILLAVLILLLTTASLPVLRLSKRRVAWLWLAALLGGLSAWGLILAARLSLPQTIPLLPWAFPDTTIPNLILRLDFVSWPFALAISTFLPALLLTALARQVTLDWRVWVGGLFLTALGLLAASAGDPYTLMLAWFSLDLVETAFLLVLGQQRALSRNLALNFAGRTLGIGLVMAAILIVHADQGASFTLAALPEKAAPFLLLAIALRLGVLPLNAPSLFDEAAMRRGIGSLLRLIPAASSLMLLTRLAGSVADMSALTDVPSVAAAAIAFSPAWLTLLMAVGALSALLGAAGWALAKDELHGRLAWLLAFSAFAWLSALQGLPEAALSWGLAGLFGGMMLFLYSMRGRFLLAFPLLSVLAVSALPFTPGWNAADLYALPWGWLLLLLPAHALLLLGYVRHALRPVDAPDASQRWIGVLYALGLFLLLVSQYWVGYLLPQPAFGAAWWGGAAVLFLTVILSGLALVWARQQIADPRQKLAPVLKLFSLEWLFRLAWWIFGLFERLIAFTSAILEGEGGLLWVLILVGVLISFYLSVGGDLVP